MPKIGLKLWSINKNYVHSAEKIFNEGMCDYIELYMVPGSMEETVGWWKDLKCPYVIHAPTSQHGVNLAQKTYSNKNKSILYEAREFADRLNATEIIIHGGCEGSIEETANQLKSIGEPRFVLENKPNLLMPDGSHGIGSTYDELNFILMQSGVKFCLDIGHAFCSAYSQQVDPISFVEKLMTLQPCMYHLSDGTVKNDYDSHLHFGKGDFPISLILKIIESKKPITIETEKNNPDNLEDYIEDFKFIKNAYGNE